MATQTTGIAVRQMTGTPSAVSQVFITLPDGSVREADLDGASFELVMQTSGKPLLKVNPAAAAAATSRVFGRVAVADSSDARGLTFRLPAPAANVVVFRNGLRQRISTDYSLPDNRTIRFVDYYADEDGATVLVDYDPL